MKLTHAFIFFPSLYFFPFVYFFHLYTFSISPSPQMPSCFMLRLSSSHWDLVTVLHWCRQCSLVWCHDVLWCHGVLWCHDVLWWHDVLGLVCLMYLVVSCSMSFVSCGVQHVLTPIRTAHYPSHSCSSLSLTFVHTFVAHPRCCQLGLNYCVHCGCRSSWPQVWL